ncbi:MAG TPA: GNAT family N-acetyltransferase [Pseudonocardiaceae bacterium]|nr:GNAT family N-acetyltransferase [Pseudonocardiaceae bacterium]
MLARELACKTVGYDNPDARTLIEAVQQEYVLRYGGRDSTPIDVADFAPPRGLFVVGYLDGVAVACGGWRAHGSADPGFADGDAEVKRMYVTPSARGTGCARALLAELERTAVEAGRLRIVLETGVQQPEAIALYTSSGYAAIPAFGIYRDAPGCRCFGKSL